VVVATATMDVDTAVRCIRHGAYDYLLKPITRDRLLTTVARALEVAALRSEVDQLQRRLQETRLRHPEHFRHIVTRDQAMLALFEYIEAVAPSPQPLLIEGETGSGKELIAEAVHASVGRIGPMVSVNVAGLDDDVFADTLFGHARGAFTGAERARDGLVAQADGGTLFLDEVGDLSRESQVKLLRLVQQRTYYRIGEDTPRTTDARIVCATNRDLSALVSEGRFREDLYYRLSAHAVRLPPLRERRGDLPLLVEHFVLRACTALHRPVPSVAADVVEVLAANPLPGNVRELEALLYDAVATLAGDVLRAADLRPGRSSAGIPPPVAPAAPPPVTSSAVDSVLLPDTGVRLPTLSEAEQQLIAAALEQAGGNQGRAAALLGISRQALNKRLARARRADLHGRCPAP